MIIQHNISARNTRRRLNENTNKVGKSLERLSSGFRINSAADDAANLAISEKIRRQITGLDTGTSNLDQGMAVSQVGDSALGEVQGMLRRVYELAEQASNGTYGEQERKMMQDEVGSLMTEIDRVAECTQVNQVFPLNFKSMGLTGPGSAGSTGDPVIDFDKIELNAVLNASGALTSSGSLNLAGVTNADGLNKKWDLVFMNGSTSHSKMRLYTNGSAVPTSSFELKSCPTVSGSYTTATDATGSIKYSLTYKYTWDSAANAAPTAATNPTDLVDLEITEHITVNPKQTDSQYYTIEYDVVNKNTAGPALEYDLMHQYDTAYNNDDHVERYYAGGASIDRSAIYTTAGNAAASGLPAMPADGFSIWGPTSELSFTGSVKYGATQPDLLFVGHWSSETPEWGYIDAPATVHGSMSPGTDLGFSMVWKKTGFAADGTSLKKHDLQFGIVRKEKDANINIGNNPPDEVIEEEAAPGLWIQSGVEAGDGFYLQCCDATVESLGLTGITVETLADSYAALDRAKKAINTVSLFRGQFGADQNRIIYSKAMNGSALENATATESVIRDVDMAKEHMNFVKNNILGQAAQAMMAQAQQFPRGVLELLN